MTYKQFIIIITKLANLRLNRIIISDAKKEDGSDLVTTGWEHNKNYFIRSDKLMIQSLTLHNKTVIKRVVNS